MRRGGGVVDPEVPTSLDDVAYWVTVSRTRTKTETMERTTELHGSVDANDAMAAFHGADSRIERLTGLPSSSGSVAPTQDALLNFVKESAASSAPHATGGSGGRPLLWQVVSAANFATSPLVLSSVSTAAPLMTHDLVHS